ncbi:Uncharacterised protein [Mycobacteroides abscessus subsp. abscessus]|nr:Uncharacterised protein [Mycobacteroides abscessus subsp. abscessus]
MVPDRFQVPINAPTASRMNSADVIDESAPRLASSTSSHRYPFLNRIRVTIAQHSMSATWSGPSSASSPKSASDPAISTASAMMGISASARLGGRGSGRESAESTRSSCFSVIASPSVGVVDI